MTAGREQALVRLVAKAILLAGKPRGTKVQYIADYHLAQAEAAIIALRKARELPKRGRKGVKP